MQSVNVFVPSESKGVRIARKARQVILLTVQRKLSDLFGGCTTYAARGAWVNQENVLVSESVTICQSYTDESKAAELWPSVVELAQWLKSALAQESVLISLTPVSQVVFV